MTRETDQSRTVIVLIVLAIPLGAATLLPAWVVWTQLPPVADVGDWDAYLRLAAALTTALVSVFVAGYILQTAASTAAALSNPSRGEGGDLDG